jgi:hypothetical protein
LSRLRHITKKSPGLLTEVRDIFSEEEGRGSSRKTKGGSLLLEFDYVRFPGLIETIYTGDFSGY